MKNILKRPYDLLESKVFRYLFVFGGSGFAFIFLWIFEPYGLYNLTTINQKILAIGLYTGIGLMLMLVHFFLLQSLVIKDSTVIKTIGWIILSFLMIGTSSSIINSYLYNNGQLNLKGFFYFQGIIFSINIIPVSIFVLIHYNITLKKRLKVASNINSSLDKRAETKINHKPIVLNSENKKEGLTIGIDSLIFICSVDNYIEVYFLANNMVGKRMLRYTLSGVEKDNKDISEIFRCHKSYIVNKSKISSITGNAADLTGEYASIPGEMKAVAQVLGKEVCRSINREQIITNMTQIRENVGDRAVLRALHFLAENDRVNQQVKALEEGKLGEFLNYVWKSGNSSYRFLQNIYSTKNIKEQELALALELTERFLEQTGGGACRVHGGGFAGTIQVFLDKKLIEDYKQYMEPIFGDGSVIPLQIRPIGTVNIDSIMDG